MIACSVEDCRNKAYSRFGICKRHYDERRTEGKACGVDGCLGGVYARNRCYSHYRIFMRTGATARSVTPAGEPRAFAESAAQALETDGCLLWPYAKAGDGYAQIRGGPTKTIYVMRLILELRGQPSPGLNMHALHSCDTPACIAWWHLRWGTATENMLDMVERGRHAAGPTDVRQERWDRRA